MWFCPPGLMDHPTGSLAPFDIAWRLGATLFFVVLNGFFVAAEFALVKVRESRIEELAADGVRSAKTVRYILKRQDRFLSACQLGITIASLVLGALGEPAVSVLILAAAGGLGFEVDGGSWLPIVSIGLAFAVITFLHMTVGEQAPKMWALQRAERAALATALPLRAFTFVFGPVIHFINSVSNQMLRWVGADAENAHEASHTADEILAIARLSAGAGQIGEREVELTERIFRMMEMEVRHILVPRLDVNVLSLAGSPEEIEAGIRRFGHSRLPLCETDLDSVIGIVHTRDVLAQALDRQALDLRALAREVLFVTDTMAVSDFLLELQRRREGCAVVLDEHGTAIGLAFLEDALEEIVGPLGDEFDAPEHEVRKLEDGSIEVRGSVGLPSLCARLGFTLAPEEDESEETIGGHVTALLGRLPRAGDKTDVGPYSATVLEIRRRRVYRVRLDPRPDDGSRDPDAT
jgi:CBS domain containing-hemolysin-like protein